MAARVRGKIFLRRRCARNCSKRIVLMVMPQMLTNGTARSKSRNKTNIGRATSTEPKPDKPWIKPARRATEQMASEGNRPEK